MKNLEHRNVLITGGSRGIGPYIARVLANVGAKVALTARSQPQLAQVAASLKETGGKRGVPYDAVYCATKAGLIEWGHALRLETAEHGVGITVICPGYVTGAGMFARFGMRPPLSMGSCTPEQVANAVVHAIQRNRGEIIVNAMPVRPFLVLGALSPTLMDWLLNRMGILSFQRRKVTHSDHGTS